MPLLPSCLLTFHLPSHNLLLIGAWPVLGVIGGALVLCGTFISTKLMFHPDIRITADKRKSDIRTWS